MTIKQQVLHWLEKYQFKVDPNLFQYLNDIETDYILEDVLFSMLEKYGAVDFSETGTSPAEYIPQVVGITLYQLGDKREWDIKSVTSEDHWETADIELIHKQGEKHNLHIIDVNDSDWVPGDLQIQLEQFTHQYCHKTVQTFSSDDPYLVVAIPHEASDDLEKIYAQLRSYID